MAVFLPKDWHRCLGAECDVPACPSIQDCDWSACQPSDKYCWYCHEPFARHKPHVYWVGGSRIDLHSECAIEFSTKLIGDGREAELIEQNRVHTVLRSVGYPTSAEVQAMQGALRDIARWSADPRVRTAATEALGVAR